MSGISTKRCESCREVVLVSDHGKVRRVGDTRFKETLPNGDAVFTCGECGQRVTWETAKVGK